MTVKVNILLFLFLLLIPFFLCAEDQKIKKSLAYKDINLELNKPELCSPNPLKQLKKFNFFAGFPAGSKNAYEEIREQIQTELKQYGKIQIPELFVKIENGKETIDPTIYSGDAFMSYELKDVYSISGEKLDIVRASLTIETLVTFDKTKAIANAYIWDDNCFLKGSAKKDVKTLVRTSLSYLLKNFLDSYKEINNEESPNFIYANY